MSKLSRDYLLCTFAIMLICWGLCVVCSLGGITISNCYLLYIPYLLGGWSPTIASFISLKKNNEISNFKEWFKNVFDFKHNVFSYLLVPALGFLFIFLQCLISGYENGAPFYAIIVMIPMMLFGGGLEEAGWRYILLPEMEKKFSFTVSTIIVGIIWWLWHMPLFFIQGVSQYGQNYLAYGITVLGLSFALASIRKNTDSVWLCVLFHCVINSLSGIYIVNENIWGNLATAVVLVSASYVINIINSKKQIFS